MAGWRDWAYGDEVSSDDFQSLVQDQVVQVYAGTATRAATLGTAVTEGMVSYLQDTNQIQVYDGSAWSTVGSSGQGNVLINGAFNVWQRGTGGATNGNYFADRWGVGVDSGSTSFAVNQGNMVWNDILGWPYQYNCQFQVNAVGGVPAYIWQRVEDVRTFAGLQVTLSFYAKSTVNVVTNPTFVQYFGSGGASPLVGSIGSATIGTSWQRYSFTFTLPSTAGKSISANSYVEIQPIRVSTSATINFTGVQLEVGSSPSAFNLAGGTLGGELAACQRYFKRFLFPDGFSICVLQAVSSTSAVGKIADFMTMRSTPTVSVSNANHFKALNSTGGLYLSSSAVNLGSNLNQVFFNSLTVASGLVAGNATFLAASNANCYLDLNAEL